METGELVRRAKQGDKDSLVKLIMDNKQDYYKLAYVYMKNKEDAMDALEDMIVVLYENIHRLKKDEAFFSWSKTILVNCCNNILRKKKKVLLMDSVEDGYYDNMNLNDEKIMVNKYLSKLNKNHQDVLKLRYYLDMDYKSISKMLKIPVGTVKSRISIALEKLRNSIGGEFNEGN